MEAADEGATTTTAAKKTKKEETTIEDDGEDGEEDGDDDSDGKDGSIKITSEVRVKGNEGRVIGKGGETIRAIERAHGVKIEMKRDRGIAVVSGADADAVRKARDAVRDVVEKGEARGPANRGLGTGMPVQPMGGFGSVGGGSAQQQRQGVAYGGSASIPAMPVSLIREPDPGEVLPPELAGDDLDAHVEIQVPCPGKEGRVIGKAGATIKEIERQSGASMKVVKGSGVCDIKGPKRLVINARRAVLDTLALQVDRFVGTSGPAQGGDWTCPGCAASVFGSRDKCFACGTPKPMQAMGGGMMGGGMMGGGAMGGMGGMGAMGAMGAVGGAMGTAMGTASHAAAAHVYGGVSYGAAASYGGYAPAYGQVSGSVPGGGGQTSLEVPCRGSEGRVIGKGGEMIKYIQNATGAKLDMKRDVGTVLVSGTPDAVAKAQGLVLEVIENGDTRDKGGLVPGAYAAQGMGPGPADAAPGMMAGGVAPGGMAPVMVAVPMGAAPGAYYAPHAAAGAYQLQQYGVPAAYGAPAQAAHAYDPAAAQAAAAAEWGQAPQAPQAQAPQAQAQAPQQTGEWQTHYSEGRAYYYNVATGETRWA